jgi:predicted dehydrogenase
VIRVGLVGLGRIGYQYDCDRGDLLISHFKAIMDNRNFKLCWVADGDAQNRARVLERLPPDCRLVAEVPVDQPETSVDLVVVATSTASHLSVVKQVLAVLPKVILCEKPVGISLAESQEIARLCSEAGVALYVNYMRRCEPAVQLIRRAIANGEMGNFYKAVCWYSGGIANNASHFINLMQFWFGDIRHAEVLAPPRQAGADPDFDFRLEFERGLSCYFLAGSEADFGSKETELLSTQGCLRYMRGGFDVVFHPKQPHEKFANYMAYGIQGEVIPNDYSHFMRYVYQQLHETFTSGTEFPSTIKTALRTREVIGLLLAQMEDTYGKACN